MRRPLRKQARPTVERLEARVVLSLTPVAAGSGTPYSAIVKLEMTYPDGEDYVGTGAMIDSYHVLTAGHVVYSAENGGWATSITAIPELDGTYEPYGSADSTNLRTFNTWITYSQTHPGETSPDALDIGLITLDQPIGTETGWLSYGYNNKTGPFAAGSVFDTAGYPATNGYDGLHMEYSSGAIDGLSSGGAGIVFHDPKITIYGGQSGSPVWSNANSVVYGVAVADGFAIRITQAVYNQLQTWTASDTAPAPLPPPPTYAPPTILNPQWYKVAMGSVLTLKPSQLLAGGNDPEGLPLSLLSVSQPLHGALVKNWRDGSYTYTPFAGYAGVDSFTIQATDGNQNSNVATINISVVEPVSPPSPSMMLVTYANGDLYQDFGVNGASFLASGVQSAGSATSPSGVLVYLVVFADGALYQYDGTGSPYLAGGVKSASIAYSPTGGPTYEVVFADGGLYQYDATGVHYLAGGVQSASIAYSPSGAPIYEVVFTDGGLYQYDGTGVHYLAGGVQSADASYSVDGHLYYEICFQDGSFYQYDATGPHFYSGDVRSASLSNAYFSPNWSQPIANVASAPRASAPAPVSVPVASQASVAAGGDWGRMRPKTVGPRPGLAAAAKVWRSKLAAAGSAQKPPWATFSIRA